MVEGEEGPQLMTTTYTDRATGDGVAVMVIEDEGTGRRVVECPFCPVVIDRMTTHGTLTALADHIDGRHADCADAGHA